MSRTNTEKAAFETMMDGSGLEAYASLGFLISKAHGLYCPSHLGSARISDMVKEAIFSYEKAVKKMEKVLDKNKGGEKAKKALEKVIRAKYSAEFFLHFLSFIGSDECQREEFSARVKALNARAYWLEEMAEEG